MFAPTKRHEDHQPFVCQILTESELLYPPFTLSSAQTARFVRPQLFFLLCLLFRQLAQHVRDIFFYAGTAQRTVVDDPLQQKYYQVHTRTINEMVGSCQMKYDALCLNTI